MCEVVPPIDRGSAAGNEGVRPDPSGEGLCETDRPPCSRGRTANAPSGLCGRINPSQHGDALENASVPNQNISNACHQLLNRLASWAPTDTRLCQGTMR